MDAIDGGPIDHTPLRVSRLNETVITSPPAMLRKLLSNTHRCCIFCKLHIQRGHSNQKRALTHSTSCNIQAALSTYRVGSELLLQSTILVPHLCVYSQLPPGMCDGCL